MGGGYQHRGDIWELRRRPDDSLRGKMVRVAGGKPCSDKTRGEVSAVRGHGVTAEGRTEPSGNAGGWSVSMIYVGDERVCTQGARHDRIPSGTPAYHAAAAAT